MLQNIQLHKTKYSLKQNRNSSLEKKQDYKDGSGFVDILSF